MLVAIDIGNTTTAIGWFKGPELCSEHRLTSGTPRTTDELEATLVAIAERHFGEMPRVSKVAICSVVPQITDAFVEAAVRLWKVAPLLVGPGVRTGLSLKVHEPQALGADRVVVALAAREMFGAPCIVVDFGTALSFDVVNAEGAYEGGVIAPGPIVALAALADNTAKLPLIDCVGPQSAIGKSTVGAMQSGLMFGYGAMIDGIVARIEAEIGPVAHVVATGDSAARFTPHARRITEVEPSLALQGLRIIAELGVQNISRTDEAKRREPQAKNS